MKSSRIGWIMGTLVGIAGVGIAPAARADSCALFPNANRPANTGARTTLSSNVTVTSATGSPNNSSWANTSNRIPGSTLTAFGTNNNATSVEVVATESDVALYMFDGGDFNGVGALLYCRKGRTCFIEDLSSRMDNKISSFICQREFFRKGVGDIGRQALNPVIPMSAISAQVDDKVNDLLGGNDDIDDIRHTNSSDGESLWSRTVWMNKTDYCRKFGLSCATTVADRFVDYMRISKRFEVDVNLPVEIIPGDDDYVIEANWYVRPVLAGSNFELRFWWARTTWWVESGPFSDGVEDAAGPAIEGVDIQTDLRNGVVAAATAAGCAACIDGNQRLQMGFFEDADASSNVVTRNFDMTSTHAKIGLNRTRDATY